MADNNTSWFGAACHAIQQSPMPTEQKIAATTALHYGCAITTDATGSKSIVTRAANGASQPTARKATTPRQRGPTKAKTATPTRARRVRKAAAVGGSSMTADALYERIPEVGGIARASLGPARDRNLTRMLTVLKNKGRLIEQNGVWFRSTGNQAQEARTGTHG